MFKFNVGTASVITACPQKLKKKMNWIAQIKAKLLKNILPIISVTDKIYQKNKIQPAKIFKIALES